MIKTKYVLINYYYNKVITQEIYLFHNRSKCDFLIQNHPSRFAGLKFKTLREKQNSANS
jgi:hypothetical protein